MWEVVIRLQMEKGHMEEIMNKRAVEIFTAGCPCCDETIKLVESLACPSCDIQVRDMRSDAAAQARAKGYGIKHVPAVVVNGKLAECCRQGVDAQLLRTLGIGEL